MIGAGLIAIIVGWIAATSLVATKIHSRPPAALARVVTWNLMLFVATVASAYFFLDARAGVSAVTGLAIGALLATMAMTFWSRRGDRREDQG
jgi:hypothetical protein